MGWTANDGVRYGLVVPQGWRDDLPGRDFERMVSVAQAAERLGFDSIRRSLSASATSRKR